MGNKKWVMGGWKGVNDGVSGFGIWTVITAVARLASDLLAMARTLVVNSVNGKFTRHGELIYLGGESWQVLFLACFLNAVFTDVCMHYDS